MGKRATTKPDSRDYEQTGKAPRLGQPVTPMRKSSERSLRYYGDWSFRALYVRRRSLNSILKIS